MSAVVSQLPVWLAALVAQLRAVPGYRAPGTVGTGIPVYDGPEIGLTEDPISTFLVVGWGGDPEEDPGEAATSTQAWRIAGPSRPREENGTIHCRAQYQTGDASISAGSMAAARAAVFGVVGDVEVLVRANPNLGTALSTNMVEIQSLRLTQWLEEGMCAALDFDLSIYNPRM